MVVLVLVTMLGVTLQGPADLGMSVASAAPGKGRSTEAPGQRDRGDAGGKPHRVEGRANHHVPLSFKSHFPDKGKKVYNEAEVVAAPEATPVVGYDKESSKELTSRRTATSVTYRNADGTETTALSDGPVNYRDAAGEWQTIEPAFVASSGGWRSEGGGTEISLARGGRATVTVERGRSVGWTLAGAADVAASVEGDTATYRGIAKATDLVVEAQASAAKETIVLRSAEAPRSFDYTLDLRGLHASVEGGEVVLTDVEDTVRAVIPAGYMMDAAGAVSDGVSYSLAGDVLHVALDKDWLADPDRSYPVRVDPSVKRAWYADAMTVYDGGARSGGADFEVGGADHRRTYLKWDLSALTNHKIFGANLSVVNYQANSCDPREVGVWEVTEGWSNNPGAYSNANAPALGRKLDSKSFAHGYVPTGGSSSPCPLQGSVFELGSAGRDLVQGWVNGGANRGLALTGGAWKRFVGPTSTANKPTLYITHSALDAAYAIPNPTPSTPVTQTTDGSINVTVTNKSAAAWGTGEYSLQYRVFDSKGKPFTDPSSFNAVTLPALARGAKATVTAKIRHMTAGMYYLDFSAVRNSDNTWFTDEQVPPVRLALRIFDIPPVVSQMYPPHGYSAPTLQPQLFAKAIDADATPGTTTYSFKVCTNSAMTTGCFTSGTATTASGWVVPSGRLTWSKQYYWNFTSGTTTSSTLTFFTDAPQPAMTSRLADAAYGAQANEFDPSLGNYATAAIDASVATTGPDLTVARTYNSLDPRTDGAFGPGWSSKFDMKARAVTTGTTTTAVDVTLPTGQQVRFGKNADGTYAAPRGRDLTFVLSGTDWKLADKEGTVYTFASATGRLTSVQASGGRPEVFTYDASGRLATVVSGNSGRGLKFTWNADPQPRVSAVATLDATGAVVTTWTYTYASGLLTKVCSPDGDCTSYDYAAGSLYRSTVLDSKPESYWRFGESAGATEATSEVAVNLGKDAATYLAAPTLGGSGAVVNNTNGALTLNGSTQAVRLPGGAAKKSRDMSVEIWFKASGLPTAGMPLAGYQNKAFDGATAPTTGVPILYVGTDGKLRGQFADGTFAPTTSTSVVTDGKWHHAVLTAIGSRTTLYLDKVVQASKTSTINQAALTYDQIGAGYATTPSSWPAYGTVSKRYFKGSIDEAAIYSHGLSDAEVTAHFDAAAGTKQLAKVTLPSGKVVSEVSYDAELNRVTEYTDHNGGTWKLGVPVVAGSSTDIRRTVVVADPADRMYLYEYDAIAGYLLRSASPSGQGLRSEDVASCKPPTAADPRFCAPPPGAPEEDVVWNITGSDVRSMDYDVNGRITAVYNELGDVVTMKYDSRGNVTERTTCRDYSNGALTNCSTTYMKYPDATSGYGPLDPRWDKPLETRDGRSASATDNTFKTSYTYTASGQLKSQTGPAPDLATVVNEYSTDTTAAEGGAGTIPSGLPVSSTDASGAVTSFGYFPTGDLASVTEPGGLVTKYTYDSLGRMKTRAEVSGGTTATTSFAYDAQSRPTKTVLPATRDEVSGVDHQQQVLKVYDEDGNVTSTEVSDVLGNDATRTTAYQYDDHNRLAVITDPLGKEVTYTYDRFGNQTSMVDATGTRTEFAYTAKNQLAEVRLRDPDRTGTEGFVVTTSYAYDAAGRPVMTFDAMGRKVVIDYLHDDLVAKKTMTTFSRPGTTADIPFVLEEYTYDKAGNVLTEKTGNGGALVTYTRDEYGRVKTQKSGSGAVTRTETFSYDKRGNIVQVDTAGTSSNAPWATTDSSSVTFAYDGAGRQTREEVSSSSGTAVTTMEYDGWGNVTKLVPPRGNASGAVAADYATTYGYDALGRQVRTTLPAVTRSEYGKTATTASGVEEAGYNTFGEQVAQRDALGNVTKLDYDTTGNLVKQTAPSYTPPGGTPVTPVTSYAYDANGNQVQVTDPLGNVTKLEYDRLGRVTKVDAPAHDDADRAVTTMDYTRTGELRRIQGPTGTKTEYTYDDLDRMVTRSVYETVPVADVLTTTYAYDDTSNLTSTTSPLGNATTSTYDGLGQMLTVKDAAGVQTSFGYDGAGRQVMVKDALGRTSKKVFDSAGRITEQANLSAAGAEGAKQSYEYDLDGNLTKSTPVGGLPTTYAYDALGQLTTQVEPTSATASITTSFGYDAAGNRTRYTDGRGNVTWSTFGSMGLDQVIEPSTTAHPALSDRTWKTSYDAAGLPVKLTAPGGVTRTRTFDAQGRVLTETGAGAEAATAARTLTYDKAGRLTSMATPTGTDSYTYNGRSQQLTASGPSGTASFAYDRDGNLVTRSDASGAASFTYSKGRLSGMTDAATGASIGFGYDAAGSPDTIDYGSGRVRSFTYDAFGRLASDTLKNPVPAPVMSTSYEYDNRNRVTRKTTTGVSGASDNRYGYDAAARLTSWTANGGTPTTYAWDAAGNRTQVNAKVSSYDQRNRLISDGTTDYSYTARGTLRSRTNGTTTESLTFDAFDRMVSEGSQAYRYDSADRIADVNGAAFKYAGLGDDVVSDGTSTFGRTVGGSLVSEKSGARQRLLVSDLHGDVVAGFDPADTTLSSVPDSRSYDPWGAKLAGAGAQPSVGYQGAWTDAATGAVNMKARWYAPKTGAFTSRDTVQYAAGPAVLANRYTYGAADPMTQVDPSGNWPSCGFCGDVVHAVSKGAKAAVSTAKHIGSTVYNASKAAGAKVLEYGKAALNAVADAGKYLYNKAKQGLSAVGNALSTAASWVGDRVADSYEWFKKQAAAAAEAAHQAALAVTAKTKAVIAHAAKYNPLPIIAKAVQPVYAGAKTLVSAVASAPARVVQATVDVVKAAAKQVEAIYNATVQAVGQVVQEVSVAISAAGEWVQDNWKSIASVAAGIAAGAACTALTAGAGTVACAALGAIVSGAVGGALTCEAGRSMAGCVGRGAVEAITAPVTDAIACVSDPTIAGCASTALTVAGGAAGKAGGRYLKKLEGGCNCFAAGTTVSTADGDKPIEKIKVGDKVWAQDMVTGTKHLRSVKKTFSHVDTRMMTMVIAKTRVRVTTEHPFHTPDRGWVRSGDLEEGDLVSRIGGGTTRVSAITYDAKPTRVYNFEVEGDHNYAVTDLDVLVHNAVACDLAPYREGRGHHIPAKKMFEGDEAYDLRDAPSIPLEYMRQHGIDHPAITGSQASQYSAFAKTGEALTWDVVHRIETAALIKGGVAEEMAGETVSAAIAQLQENGVAIQRIPWGK